MADQEREKALQAAREFALLSGGATDAKVQPTAQTVSDEVKDSSLQAARIFMTGDDSDPAATSLAEDAERFTASKPYDTAAILGSYVNKGLVGNFLDLPFVLGNMVTDVANRKLGTEIPPANLPSQNLLGLDTGIIFNPDRQSSNEELKKSLRPLGVGLEFATSVIGPQALLSKTAGAMTAPAIRQTPFGASSQLGQKVLPSKGPQALTPTPIARQPLPKDSVAKGASVAQQMTSAGANKANAILGGISGAGAMGGSYLSEGNPLAEAIGGITLPVAYVLGAKTVGNVGQQFNILRAGKSEGKSTEAALNAISYHAENPAQALKNLRQALADGKTGNLAVLTKDEGIAGLTKFMQKRAPSAGAQEEGGVAFNSRLLELDERTARELGDVVNNISDEAAGGFFKNFIQGREESLKRSVNGLVANAEKQAATDLQLASSGLLDDSQASRSLFENIQKADDIATKGLKEGWQSVPKPFVSRKNVKSFADGAIDKNWARTDQAKVAIGSTFDKYIKALVSSADKGRVSVDELITFRSNVLGEIRKLQGARESNATIEAFGQQLQNDAMDLIANAPGKGVKYKAMAEETRIVKDIFDRATFNYKKDPATLGKRVLAGGEKGIDNAEQLARMAGYNDGIIGAMDDTVRSAFHSSAIKINPVTGAETVNPVAGQRFLKKHYETLQKPEYAQVRAELEDAVRSQVVSQNLSNKGPKFMSERSKQAFNTFSEFDFPEDAVASIIRSKSPTGEAKLLVRQAAKDNSGLALEGLQRNFIDAIIAKAFQPGGADVAGKITARQWKQMRGATQEIFKNKPESITVLDDVFDQIAAINKAKGAKQVDASMASNMAADAILKMAGVTVGGSRGLGKLTGSPLMTAGVTSQFFRKYFATKPIEKTFGMIEELIINPSIYKDQLSTILKSADEVDTVLRLQTFADGLSAGLPPALSPEEYEPEVTY